MAVSEMAIARMQSEISVDLPNFITNVTWAILAEQNTKYKLWASPPPHLLVTSPSKKWFNAEKGR